MNKGGTVNSFVHHVVHFLVGRCLPKAGVGGMLSLFPAFSASLSSIAAARSNNQPPFYTHLHFALALHLPSLREKYMKPDNPKLWHFSCAQSLSVSLQRQGNKQSRWLWRNRRIDPDAIRSLHLDERMSPHAALRLLLVVYRILHRLRRPHEINT